MGHGVSGTIALFAEAGPAIGTGHMIETLAVAGACHAAGIETLLVVNSETAEPLFARIRGERRVVPAFTPDSLQGIGEELVRAGVRLVVTNFAAIANAQVAALTGAGLRVVCVDERGGRRVSCDAVVNPSIVPLRHQYTSDRPGFRLYTGPSYMALVHEYAAWHARPRRFEGRIRSIVVSMGGVDRTGATLRIVESLGSTSDLEVHIVAGAGFTRMEELRRVVEARDASRWHVHRDVASPAPLFAAGDVAFTAGGNTLYELACLGTPAIVLHEDDHEREQGLAFQERGFGVWGGAGAVVAAEALRALLDRFGDPAFRQAQSAAGRRLVDGAGARRICRILAESMTDDSTFPSKFGAGGFRLHR